MQSLGLSKKKEDRSDTCRGEGDMKLQHRRCEDADLEDGSGVAVSHRMS